MKVCTDENETAQLFEAVLDGNKNVAKILASEVHRKVQINDIIFDNDKDTTKVPDIHIDIDRLGFWIDPIGNLKFICYISTNLIYSDIYINFM